MPDEYKVYFRYLLCRIEGYSRDFSEQLSKNMKEQHYDFGLVGLGVMGRNFILNVADNGFKAAGLDVSTEQVEALIKEGGNPLHVNATSEASEFVASLKTPRKIMMLVPAGKIVDQVIEDLLPLLEEGDLLIDGGNSYYTDTDRREAYLKEKGILYLGAGVSGGAEGARKGPSIMPGGSLQAYPLIQPVFEAASAKFEGEPCVAYMGARSAGNYVKMVHNGIEYALMQLLSEGYDLMKKSSNATNLEMSACFQSWNEGRLQSFLVEITSEILQQKDPLEEGFLIDRILDKAKQKGTGKWTSQNAMDLGVPVPTIDIAVTMREMSALKPLRELADSEYHRPIPESLEKDSLLKMVEEALYFGYLISYAQGMHLLAEASREYQYNLPLVDIAKIWRSGCIIRAILLEDIAKAYQENPSLPHLLLAPSFIEKTQSCVASTRELLSYGIRNGISLPALSASLTYFENFSSRRMPTNMIQAQRDYFGSHTYERTDREGTFHTDWSKI